MQLYTFVFLSLCNVGKDCKYNQIVTDTLIYNVQNSLFKMSQGEAKKNSAIC